jgi:hypothetical protein
MIFLAFLLLLATPPFIEHPFDCVPIGTPYVEPQHHEWMQKQRELRKDTVWHLDFLLCEDGTVKWLIHTKRKTILEEYSR